VVLLKNFVMNKDNRVRICEFFMILFNVNLGKIFRRCLNILSFDFFYWNSVI
jgi:hypothetical protein